MLIFISITHRLKHFLAEKAFVTVNRGRAKLTAVIVIVASISGFTCKDVLIVQ